MLTKKLTRKWKLNRPKAENPRSLLFKTKLWVRSQSQELQPRALSKRLRRNRLPLIRREWSHLRRLHRRRENLYQGRDSVTVMTLSLRRKSLTIRNQTSKSRVMSWSLLMRRFLLRKVPRSKGKVLMGRNHLKDQEKGRKNKQEEIRAVLIGGSREGLWEGLFSHPHKILRSLIKKDLKRLRKSQQIQELIL